VAKLNRFRHLHPQSWSRGGASGADSADGEAGGKGRCTLDGDLTGRVGDDGEVHRDLRTISSEWSVTYRASTRCEQLRYMRVCTSKQALALDDTQASSCGWAVLPLSAGFCWL